MATTRPPKKIKVSIPLSDKMKKVLAASDEDYANVLNALLGPTDRPMTYLFRYPMLFTGLATDHNVFKSIASDTSPFSIALKSLFLLSCAAASFTNAYDESKEQDKRLEDHVIDYQSTTALLENKLSNNDSKENSNAAKINRCFTFDELQEILKLKDGMHKYRKKYSDIKFEQDSIVFYKNEEKEAEEQKEKNWKYYLWDRAIKYYFWQRFVNDFVVDTLWSPIWNGGGTAAFVFWIMWISAATFTGKMDLSISGMPIWAVAAIPVLAYVVPKVYVFLRQVWNYSFENKEKLSWSEFREQEKLKAEVNKDLDPLMKKIMEKTQYDANTKKLFEQLKLKDKEQEKYSATEKYTVTLKSNTDRQTGIVFLTHSASSWAKTQNIAWIAIICTQAVGVALVIPFLGHMLMAIALIYGVADAYKRHQDMKSLAPGKVLYNVDDGALSLERAKELKKEQETKLSTLKLGIKAHLESSRGEELKKACFIPPTFVPQPTVNKTKWERFKNWARKSGWFGYLDHGMTGVLVGRLFFVVGTAFFMPFAALALASNPLTIGLVVAVGVTYVALKWYEKLQEDKEKEAKELPGELEELDRQIKLADLTLKNIHRVKAAAPSNDHVVSAVALDNHSKATHRSHFHANADKSSSSDEDVEPLELQPTLSYQSSSSVLV